MARHRRIFPVGFSLHVMLAGHCGQPCFLDAQDFAAYWDALEHASRKFGCRVHAYAILPACVHLLVLPSAEPAFSRMMQSVGRLYGGYFNGRYRRSGTIWNGRYKASIVGPCFLLNCSLYIDKLSPLAVGAESPGVVEWTSFRANALAQRDQLVVPSSEYLALSGSSGGRAERYRELLAEGLPSARVAEIDNCIAKQLVLGSEEFKSKLWRETGARIAELPRGRPPQTGSRNG